MNFGSTNPAPILRDHFLRIPALQKVEPVAQTFADVRKLASNSGNNDGQGGRSGTFGDGYEAAKEQLRQEAEQEFLYNTTDWGQTMIRNFAVNPDAPYMAGLVNYLQLLLQSPKGLEYTRYTAADQEAEKAQRIEEIKEWANENGYSPLLSALYGEDTNGILNLPSGISLVTAPFQGADYLLDALETAYVGAPLPSSTPDITETTQALREGVSQNMTETGQFFYNATMSTADSLIAGWLGGGSTGGGIILGMGAASNTAHDIINRGGTAEDALIGGAVSGILEGVFEKASLGQLKAMRTLPADSAKAVLGNIAKSVVTNASEELATELANTIFDTIFMDELSTYALTVQGYLSQGKSETDARWLANTDLLKRLSESAAAGALTGVLFGTGASADSYYRSQLAAQGEAKLRTMEMPTPRELEAMNASEAEARGAMVLLNMEQVDGEVNGADANEPDQIDTVTESINGARITDTESSAAEAHAERYYGLARSMTTDVTRIAKNTGYSEELIRRIKNFIFMDEHDLGGTKPRRFDPNFAMAQSWQRLIAGTPEPHDLTMLKHEILESELMDAGMSQYDAHIAASEKYNYTKESNDYYGSFGQH